MNKKFQEITKIPGGRYILRKYFRSSSGSEFKILNNGLAIQKNIRKKIMSGNVNFFKRLRRNTVSIKSWFVLVEKERKKEEIRGRGKKKWCEEKEKYLDRWSQSILLESG